MRPTNATPYRMRLSITRENDFLVDGNDGDLDSVRACYDDIVTLLCRYVVACGLSEQGAQICHFSFFLYFDRFVHLYIYNFLYFCANYFISTNN